MDNIEHGIGQDMCLIITQTSLVISALSIAFYRTWRATLVSLAIAPFLICGTGSFYKVSHGKLILYKSRVCFCLKLKQLVALKDTQTW